MFRIQDTVQHFRLCFSEFDIFFGGTTLASGVLQFSMTAFFLLHGLTRGEEGEQGELFVGVCCFSFTGEFL